MILLLLACTGAPDVQALLDPATCAGCHPDHVAQWEGSMHAYATEDPVFRAMNARAQREADVGDFCVRCHAPVAVALGETDGTDLDSLPEHLGGVTCIACHGIDSVQQVHNAGFTLSLDGLLRGGFADPIDNPVHDAAYSPLHDRNDPASATLCGSCHDVVTPAGVHLERTYEQWSETVFATEGSVRQSCGHCHMRGRDGVVTEAMETPVRRLHDHTMAAVDVALTDFPRKEEQTLAVEEELSSVLLAGLCVEPVAGGFELVLQLENQTAGHHFPSGASHDRVAWAEVQGFRGEELLFESPWRVDFNDLALDEQGEQAHLFWEVASIEERSLPGAGPQGVGHVKEWRLSLLGEAPDRLQLQVWLTPMAPALLQDLEQSGDLDPAVSEAMPTWSLLELSGPASVGSCLSNG